MKPLPAVATTAIALTIALSPTAHAVPTADPAWSGFPLTTKTTASGGWLGARKADGQVVYRIDPSRPKAVTSSLKPAAWASLLTGAGPRKVSATDTARAAWLVGKYGDYRYDIQNAAVEVALNELLHGGRWSLNGAATRKRLKQTSRGSQIRSFARTMLASSTRYAGPYAVAVTPTSPKTGGRLAVAVKVTASRTKVGIASLPVTVTYAGTTYRGLRTAQDGTVTTSFPAGAAGTRDVTVVVDRLPETRLLVRTPATAGASRVIVAGRKTSRTTTVPAVVKTAPRLTTTSTSSTITTTQSPTGQFSVTGSQPGTRTATVSLYGPFGSAAAATCAKASLAMSGTVAVTGNGSYSFPGLRVPRYGYYIWGVGLPADASNAAASACAGTVLARVTPEFSVAPSKTQYRTRSFVQALLTLGSLPTGYAGTATMRLYGPFTTAGSVACTSSKLKATETVQVSQNGSITGPDVWLTNLGYYVWAADLPESTFSLARSTSCTATKAVFQVTW